MARKEKAISGTVGKSLQYFYPQLVGTKPRLPLSEREPSIFSKVVVGEIVNHDCRLPGSHHTYRASRYFIHYCSAIGATRLILEETSYHSQRDIDKPSTQHYNCVVIPAFDRDGYLPPGVHPTTWAEFEAHFSHNAHRRRLLSGLYAAAAILRRAGCSTLFIGGSYTTAKELPNDFDGCWDPHGVDPYLLDLVLLDFTNGRIAQKTKYGGELFLANGLEADSGIVFLDFFQTNRYTGNLVGIVAIDLGSLP